MGISWLFGEGDEYKLATWPNLNLDLVPIEGTIGLKTWDAGDTAWISDDTGIDSNPMISGYNIFLMIGVIGIIYVAIIRKKLRR